MTTPPIQPPMIRSATTLFAKVLLQLQLLISGVRTIRRSQDDDEEREHLAIREYSAPHTRPLHPPSPSPQSGVGSLPTSDLNDATLLQRYALMARESLLSLPSPCCSLGSEDVKLVGEGPIAAGGFADIWEATYGGRKVILKSYRCYRSFDATQVATVRHNPLCRVRR